MAAILIAESVSKKFLVQHHLPVSLVHSVAWKLFWRNQTGKHEDIICALENISFSVEHGQSLGIIGHNGAGKSTLLRLLCGLGRPTAGNIYCTGKVSGLLELGSGFHPDMTGRENLMTGGLISGLTKRQVLEKQQEIIEFAELEEFIDQPTRTYSNGMYLRLAFSAAIHFHPDVLVIDELLAVGDSRFQQKCIEWISNFRSSGKTMILTSHDTEKIHSLCDEVLVLEEGKLVMQGEPESAIRCYHDLMRQRTEKRVAQLSSGHVQPDLSVKQGKRTGTQEATICAVHFYNMDGKPTSSLYSGNSLTIVLDYRLNKPLRDMALILGIYSKLNVKCFETYIGSIAATFGPMKEYGRIRCYLPALHLLPDSYYINVGLFPINWEYIYDYHWEIHVLQILSKNKTPSEFSGVVSVIPDWFCE